MVSPTSDSTTHVETTTHSEARGIVEPSLANEATTSGEHLRTLPQIAQAANDGPPDGVADDQSAARASSRRRRRATLRMGSMMPPAIEATPAPANATTPAVITPIAAAVTRVRAVHVVSPIERPSDRPPSAEVAPRREDRETQPDLGLLRRYSVTTPFAIDAPHTGWRWFVGLATLALVASGVLMLFDAL